MKCATEIALAHFVCAWWLEAPEKSIAMIVCEDAQFRDDIWAQVTREAKPSGVGYIYHSIQEWRLKPNGQGVGSVKCFSWRNKYSEDKLRGMHAERQLAILQGDPGWALNVQERIMSFPLEALCLVIKKL